MTCEACKQKERRIAQLERDLQQTAEAVDMFKTKWLAEKEKGK